MKLGYCRLIYYAFLLSKNKWSLPLMCRNCVEKIKMTGKIVLPSILLAFLWEFAPFSFSSSLSKAALNSTYNWFPAFNEGSSLYRKIVNLRKIYDYTQASANALQTISAEDGRKRRKIAHISRYTSPLFLILRHRWKGKHLSLISLPLALLSLCNLWGFYTLGSHKRATNRMNMLATSKQR